MGNCSAQLTSCQRGSLSSQAANEANKLTATQFAQSTIYGWFVAAAMFGAFGLSLATSWHATSKLSHLRVRLLDHPPTDADEKRLHSAFVKIDSDGSGSLDPEELASVCSELGVEMKEEELQATFSLLDRNRNGKVDFHEFRSFCLDEPGYAWA